MMKAFTLIILLLGSTLLYSQQKQTILSVAQMHADLSILKSALTSLHPGIYRYLTAAQLDLYFEETKIQTNRPLSLNVFYIKLSQLTTKLKCGHTYLNPYNQKEVLTVNLQSDLVVPLLFKVIGKHMIVTHNLSDETRIKPGDEIVRVNGFTNVTIIDSLLTVSRSDGKNGFYKQLDNIAISPYLISQEKHALFDIYFPLFFAGKSAVNNYEIAIRPFKDKRLVTYQVHLVSKPVSQQKFQDRFPAEAMQPTGSFKWISPRCGYLKIRDFSTKGWGKNYERFLDSVFIDLEKVKASQLIVDIRGNEGGDDDVRNKVISYLITHPANYAIKRYFRYLTVPDSLKAYLQTWDPSFKKPKLACEYQLTKECLYYKKTDNPLELIIPNRNRLMVRFIY
jgi:hypothetical protein